MTREDVVKRYNQARDQRMHAYRNHLLRDPISYTEYKQSIDNEVSWQRVLFEIDFGVDPTIAVLRRR